MSALDARTAATRAAARLPRLHRAAAPRARAADRLGRRAEGGLPGRRAVRDAARHDRVDRDRRRGLERARRPRPRRRAGRAASARGPPSGRRCTATGAPASAWSPRWRGWRHEARRRRPRLLGPQPRPQLRGAARTASSRGSATPTRPRSSAWRAPSPARARRPSSTTCWTIRSSTRSCSPRRCRRTRSSPCACCGPASTASSRSRWRSTSPPPSGRVAAAARPAGCSWSATCSSTTRRRQAQGARRRRRPRRHPLHLLEPPEPGQAARTTRTRCGRSARTTSRSCCSSPARSRSRSRRTGECYIQPGHRGRRLRVPALPVRAGGAPAPVVAGPAQGAALHRRRLAPDGDVRRHGARAQGHGLRQGLRRGRALLRRVHHALGRHLEPARPQPRAAAARVRALRRVHPRGSRAAVGRASGLRVVRVLEALQQRLDASRGDACRLDRRARTGDGVVLGEASRSAATWSSTDRRRRPLQIGTTSCSASGRSSAHSSARASAALELGADVVVGAVRSSSRARAWETVRSSAIRCRERAVLGPGTVVGRQRGRQRRAIGARVRVRPTST